MRLDRLRRRQPAASPPPEAAFQFKVATWNIHSGIGTDGRYDAKRIIDVLGEIDADVVALQEVPSLTLHADLLLDIQLAFGYRVAVARTLVRRQADFGNAVLSRYPIAGQVHLDLTVERCEPRNAIDVHIAIPGALPAGCVRVIATHLGLRPSERRHQVRRILECIEAEPQTGTMLMGDINEWYLWGRPLKWLHRRFSIAPGPPTFPSQAPVFALDRIWVHRPGMLGEVRVHRSALARKASDHLPLTGRFTMPVLPTSHPEAVEAVPASPTPEGEERRRTASADALVRLTGYP